MKNQQTICPCVIRFVCIPLLCGPLYAANAAAPDAPTNLRIVPNTNVDCVRQVWQNLEVCGWPGPANTGYPSGTQLRATQGRTISVDNTIIDGEKITGGLVVAAKNVIVRNSWIISSFGTGEAVNGTGVINIRPGASATIEHSVLDGSNRTHAGIWYEGVSLVATANNIFGVNDGIFSWYSSNLVIENNYLHNFTTQTANGHIDGFQWQAGSHGILRHNTFDISQDQTSCIMIAAADGDMDDILVDNNLMAGGGFCAYAQANDPMWSGNSLTNVYFTNNKFSTVHYPCVGNWGVWYVRGAPTDGWRRSGNMVLETGQNIDTKNPVVNGVECR